MMNLEERISTLEHKNALQREINREVLRKLERLYSAILDIVSSDSLDYSKLKEILGMKNGNP